MVVSLDDLESIDNLPVVVVTIRVSLPHKSGMSRLKDYVRVNS